MGGVVPAVACHSLGSPFFSYDYSHCMPGLPAINERLL